MLLLRGVLVLRFHVVGPQLRRGQFFPADVPRLETLPVSRDLRDDDQFVSREAPAALSVRGPRHLFFPLSRVARSWSRPSPPARVF